MWDDYHDGLLESFPPQSDQESFTNFDPTVATKFKNYYKTLEVDYDATDDDIRANYIRLALEYLNRFKGLILTCNGLGVKHPIR